jgi:RimJ/RimL family protein N-acetyltransferase
VALALHEVGPVDPGRHDVDEHLARPGDRVRRRSPAQHFRPAGGVQRYRVHGREGSAVEHWPLRHLILRTPRLELRPDDDAGLDELVDVAYEGVHAPEEMPFAVAWTDADPRYLGRGVLQYYWSERAALTPERWSVHFLVRIDGRVIGTQALSAREFAITREAHTGSWIGLRHQGRGIGTEMRAAVLLFAFDHLGAQVARSGANTENPRSLGVSRRLGYRRDGTETVVRRGRRTEDARLVVTPPTLVRPGWTLEVEGYGADCRALLGGISPG